MCMYGKQKGRGGGKRERRGKRKGKGKTGGEREIEKGGRRREAGR